MRQLGPRIRKEIYGSLEQEGVKRRKKDDRKKIREPFREFWKEIREKIDMKYEEEKGRHLFKDEEKAQRIQAKKRTYKLHLWAVLTNVQIK